MNLFEMKTIHYISYYNCKESGRLLETQPSSVSKVDYIADSLVKAGFNVHIVSLSEGNLHSKFKLNHIGSILVEQNKRVFFFFTFSRNNILLKALSRLLIYFQLLFYLLSKVKNGDRILVYHSLSNMWFFRLYNHFTSKPICLEIEEVYNAVYQNVDKIDKEIEYFNANKFSGFILVNDIIAEKCGIKKKSIVCYGKYNVEDTYRDSKIQNETINIVYAGLISSQGSDVYLAVDIARHLPGNYRIFILGYGSDFSIADLIRYIDQSNVRNECKVSYEGCLQGDDYLRFLRTCQIGLCTRILKDELSNYTFPSKVMAYLSYGLIPVCTPISCVQQSKISDLVLFSEDISSESIASIILRIDFSLASLYRDRLNMLDLEFVKSLRELFC